MSAARPDRALRAGAAATAVAIGLCSALATSAAARADEPAPLTASVSTSAAGPVTTSSVDWELPATARPGDTLRLALPEHAGGVMAGTDWIAATGAAIGTATYDPAGALVLVLGEAAAVEGNRHGSASVRSTAREADPVVREHSSSAVSTLRPGARPDETATPADRTRGAKFGVWADEAQTHARWTLEAPRGPWDELVVTDAPGAGHRIDCAAGVSVRATSTLEPGTGHLLDQVAVPADRVSISCDADRAEIVVAPVGDEVVEVTLTTTVDSDPTGETDAAGQPAGALENTGTFAASIAEPGARAREVSLAQFVEPAPTGPPPAPTPEPTPPAPEPTPPAPEPTPEPPGASTPPRLARTGGEAPLTVAAIGAALVAVGVAASAAGAWRRAAGPHSAARRRGGGDT